MSNAALDKKILLPTIAIVLLTSAPLIFYASSLQGMIQSIYDFTAKSFGWGYTRDHGLQRLNGITMPNNRGMVALARKLGFNVDIQLEEGIVGLTLSLAQREES